jgi:hypothetical protein
MEKSAREVGVVPIFETSGEPTPATPTHARRAAAASISQQRLRPGHDLFSRELHARKITWGAVMPQNHPRFKTPLWVHGCHVLGQGPAGQRMGWVGSVCSVGPSNRDP